MQIQLKNKTTKDGAMFTPRTNKLSNILKNTLRLMLY